MPINVGNVPYELTGTLRPFALVTPILATWLNMIFHILNVIAKTQGRLILWMGKYATYSRVL